MKYKNVFLSVLIIAICQTPSLSHNGGVADSILNSPVGIKVNMDFYDFIAFDTARTVQGDPKIIETQNYYYDLKKWDWEDSSLYDAKGRLIYFNNYHDVKSFIYDDDKLLYYSRKDSDRETYVYWFFYDSSDNPRLRISAVRDNFTGEYKLYEVEKYHAMYYHDSVVVNKKSSKEFMVDKNGFTSVFDRNGNLTSESYVRKDGVFVYETFIYLKFGNQYVLKEKEIESSREQIKYKRKTIFTLDSLGNVVHKEEQNNGIFQALIRQNSISTSMLKDSVKRVREDQYLYTALQHTCYHEYDKFGNVIKEADITYGNDNSFYFSIYDYRYDSKNNWISKTEYMQETDRDLKPTRKKMKLVSYARKITYYEKGERYVPEKVPEIPAALMVEINKLEKELE